MFKPLLRMAFSYVQQEGRLRHVLFFILCTYWARERKRRWAMLPVPLLHVISTWRETPGRLDSRTSGNTLKNTMPVKRGFAARVL